MVMSNKQTDAYPWPGASTQFAALAAVGAIGLIAAAWALVGEVTAVLLGGALYGVAATVAFVGVTRSFPHRMIGLCNGATLMRLVMVGVLVAALVADAPPAWGVFGIALVAFSLDGLDGWLARHEGRASEFGARFDMEVDSLLALVLALLAWQSGTVGTFVIILGLPRYAFWAAQFPFPWLNGTLPERFSRKVACVVQISALVLALYPPVPASLAGLVAAFAAIGLIWSFAVDVRFLRRAGA